MRPWSNPGMARKRKRRLVIVAILVLLPVWYVGAWFALSKAGSSGSNAFRAIAVAISPVFKRIGWYCRADLPGSTWLIKEWWKMHRAKLYTRDHSNILIEMRVIELAPNDRRPTGPEFDPIHIRLPD
jgi:hypothetical protein